MCILGEGKSISAYLYLLAVVLLTAVPAFKILTQQFRLLVFPLGGQNFTLK